MRSSYLMLVGQPDRSKAEAEAFHWYTMSHGFVRSLGGFGPFSPDAHFDAGTPTTHISDAAKPIGPAHRGTSALAPALRNAGDRGRPRTKRSHRDPSEIRSRLDPLRERRTVSAAGCARSAHRRCTVPSVGRRAHDFALWHRLRIAAAPCHGPTSAHCLAGTNHPVGQHAAPEIRHRQRHRRWRAHTHHRRGSCSRARRSRCTTGVGTARCGGRMGYGSLVDSATSSNTQSRPVGRPRIPTSRSRSRTHSLTARM